MLVGAGGAEVVETKMISAALEFIHARKWLVELILLGVLVAGVTWFCHHLIGVGVQRERAAWVEKLALQQRAADVELGRKQGIADAAEKARETSDQKLADYIRDNPVHGGLCQRPTAAARLPAAGRDPGDARAAASGGDVQPVLSGDSGAVGQGDPDVRGMLSTLYSRADLLSNALRERQARDQ